MNTEKVKNSEAIKDLVRYGVLSFRASGYVKNYSKRGYIAREYIEMEKTQHRQNETKTEQSIDRIAPLFRFWMLSGAIGYFNTQTKPNLPNMEEWERKEYFSCYEKNVLDAEELQNFLVQKESIYNEFLYSCPLKYSLSVFIAKCQDKMELNYNE